MTSGAYSIRCYAAMLVLAVALATSTIFASAELNTADILGVARLQVNSTVLHRSGEWFEVRVSSNSTGLEGALIPISALFGPSSQGRAILPESEPWFCDTGILERSTGPEHS